MKYALNMATKLWWLCHPSSVTSPSLLPSKPLVEQCKDLGNIKLNVFQVQFVLVILLHLKKIIKLEIEFEQSSVSAFELVSA